MKQLLIISGKGGTGKTTIAAAFIQLVQARACADCDVDAPNLHLLLQQPSPPQEQDFYALPVAEINPSLCQNCGRCAAQCRFGAIKKVEGVHQVNPYACEGCGVCVSVCPAQAAGMMPDPAGRLMLYSSPESVFSTACLNMGKGTSGLLVTEVKKRMKAAAPPAAGIAVIDGSPGIGCPVIASLTGVDMALIVAEPSVSGISDMARVLTTAAHFGIPAAVCVNRWDTYPEKTEEIQAYCRQHSIPFAGKIPYDKQVVQAVNSGQSIVQAACPSGRAVEEIFRQTMAMMGGAPP